MTRLLGTRALGPRVAMALALTLVLVLSIVLWLGSPGARGQSSPQSKSSGYDPALVSRGEQLFIANCASCHGASGGGTSAGPPLIDVGAAAADFMLRTGRMPAANSKDQALRRDPAYSEGKIRALTAFVASLDDGPGIPTVDLAGSDLGRGEELFLQNCAPCHGSTGVGGTVGNVLAPGLKASEPVDVAEAVIIGPGQMPAFAFDQSQRDDLAAFVKHLQGSTGPGGADIGAVGPVPEGFVAWGIGLGVVIFVLFLIGRSHVKPEGEVEAGHEG